MTKLSDEPIPPGLFASLSTRPSMAPSKRKFDEIEDSDSEEPSFGKQILPVADLPDDFDAEPQDGMQYLFTVR